MLAASPEWLADRYHLAFFAGSDNLDAYRAAAVRLPSGRRIGLLRHEGAPDGGTEVHADAQDDPAAAVSELLAALGLPPGTCTWIRETPATTSPQRVAAG